MILLLDKNNENTVAIRMKLNIIYIQYIAYLLNEIVHITCNHGLESHKHLFVQLNSAKSAASDHYC